MKFEISNLIFLILLTSDFIFFYYKIKKIFRNIRLGRDGVKVDKKKERWKRVFFIAFGQSKMFDKPLVAVSPLADSSVPRTPKSTFASFKIFTNFF